MWDGQDMPLAAVTGPVISAGFGSFGAQGGGFGGQRGGFGAQRGNG
jgi:hypothetical protein